MPPLLPTLAAWLIAINAAAFLAYAADKRLAVTGRGRIPERRLLQLAALGGGLGAIAAQQAFRHKTRKQPFQTRFRLIMAAQAALVVCLLALMPRLVGS